MRYFLYLVIVFVLDIRGIAQTTYTASWKLEYSLPFSPQKYTDVTFQLNENLYPLGRFAGRYTPIDNKHPFFQRLPENAFIALKEMTNDTAQVIYACKESGQISIYEYNPKRDIKEANAIKTIILQTQSSADIPNNTDFTWQFEEFVQDNISYTNLIIIINQKPYKVGIYEGKCRLLETREHKNHDIPENIQTAVQVKEKIIAVKLSEKECVVYEKQPNQELKVIKTFTL